MSKTRNQLALIFLTIFIDMVGFGIVIPVLPRYAEHYGATAIQNGLLIASFSFAQFFASPLLGKLSDRVGRKPVIFVSIVGTAFGFFLMGTAQTLAMLFVARIIDGIAGGNIGAAQAYIADVTPREKRSRAMGLIGAAFGLGFVFGPAIGGWMSAHFGFQSPMLLAGGMAVVNALLILLFLPESLPPERRGHQSDASIFEVLQHCDRRVYTAVTATYFFVITGFSMMTFVFALFVWHRFGLDEKATGNIFAMVGMIGVLIQGGLIGRLVKGLGEARLATLGALVLCVSLLALPLCGGMTGLLILSAGVAVGNSLMMPCLMGLASQSVDQNWQGRALGLLQSAGSLARWVGPAVAGLLLSLDVGRAKEFYARTPLWTGAVLVGLSLVITLFLPRARPALEDQPTSA